MARRIEKIVIHYSATSPEWRIGVNEIRCLHATDPSVDVEWDGRTLPGRGWSDVGYHWVIRRDGLLEPGRPEKRIGAHAKGWNTNSLGICLVGGVDKPFGSPEANFTKAQYAVLEDHVHELVWQHKDAEVIGHRDLPGANTPCPGFNVRAWWDAT